MQQTLGRYAISPLVLEMAYEHDDIQNKATQKNTEETARF